MLDIQLRSTLVLSSLMRHIYLAAYLIKIPPVIETAQQSNGRLVDGTDLLNHAEDYFRFRSGHRRVDDDEQQSLFVRSYTVEASDRIVHGLIDAGEFGVRTNLINVKTGAQRERSVDETDEWPFYFVLYLPADKTSGILILQRTGNVGIRTRLVDDLNEYIRSKGMAFSLDANPMALTEMYDAMLEKGRMTEVRLIQHIQPTALDSRLEQAYEAEVQNGKQRKPRERYAEIAISVQPRNKWWFKMTDQWRKWIRGEEVISDLVVVAGFVPEHVEVELTYQGRTKVIRVGRQKDSRAWEDISDRVQKADDGHPDYASIGLIAREYLVQMMVRIP